MGSIVVNGLADVCPGVGVEHRPYLCHLPDITLDMHTRARYTVEQKKTKYILVLIICLSDAKMVYL